MRNKLKKTLKKALNEAVHAHVPTYEPLIKLVGRPGLQAVIFCPKSEHCSAINEDVIA